MKKGLISKIFVVLLCILAAACHPDTNEGKSLAIKNNSDERIYFWYSKTYSTGHYPDTILPAEKPIYINSAVAHGKAGAGSEDPDWNKIYSELPAGKLSVYFFPTNPSNQQDWDAITNNPEGVERIDITLEALKQNDYIIEYP